MKEADQHAEYPLLHRATLPDAKLTAAPDSCARWQPRHPDLFALLLCVVLIMAMVFGCGRPAPPDATATGETRYFNPGGEYRDCFRPGTCETFAIEDWDGGRFAVQLDRNAPDSAPAPHQPVIRVGHRRMDRWVQVVEINCARLRECQGRGWQLLPAEFPWVFLDSAAENRDEGCPFYWRRHQAAFSDNPSWGIPPSTQRDGCRTWHAFPYAVTADGMVIRPLGRLL
jgi:hypothetical protein